MPTVPCAVRAEADENGIRVALDDDRMICVPLEWYPRLMHATDAERQNCEVFGSGTAIEWPDIDEHISVEGLLAGRASGESERSFLRWLDGRKKPQE